MKPLDTIYWIRVCLGVTAAVLCSALGLLRSIMFLDGVVVVVIFYMLTNFILRRYFITKVKNTSKVFTMGIGAYFLVWVVTWVLLYTILNPAG